MVKKFKERETERPGGEEVSWQNKLQYHLLKCKYIFTLDAFYFHTYLFKIIAQTVFKRAGTYRKYLLLKLLFMNLKRTG